MPWWHNLYFNPLYSLSLYIHLYLSIFIQWFMIGFSLVCLFCHWHLLSFLWTKDTDSVTIEIGSCQRYKDFCPCAADCSACLRFSSMVCWGLVVYVSIASWENEQLHAADKIHIERPSFFKANQGCSVEHWTAGGKCSWKTQRMLSLGSWTIRTNQRRTTKVQTCSYGALDV